MLFYSLAAVIFVLDQILKNLVNKYMVIGQSLPIIDNIVKLTYVRNTGAAFSLFLGYSSYLIVIGILAMLVIIYFHLTVPRKHYYSQVALAFILGGSLGNLFDRISRGFVIDYIDFGFWPVFNLADIMINIGVVMIAAHILKEDKKSINDVSDLM
ncbi:MAG: signal peptidase II [Candidatus Margulisbacteria bacterium]|nr:signal peptidase II [Candidatus Margulisiibacteriota bacterium]